MPLFLSGSNGLSSKCITAETARHLHLKLDSTCTVLGLFRDWSCAMAECRLESGDILVLYTDGITESVDRAGAEFGEERLIHSLRCRCGMPPQDLLNSIVEEVRKFSPHEQHDDITLIVAKGKD